MTVDSTVTTFSAIEVHSISTESAGSLTTIEGTLATTVVDVTAQLAVSL